VRIRRAIVKPSSGRTSTSLRQRRLGEYTRPAEPPATGSGPGNVTQITARQAENVNQ